MHEHCNHQLKFCGHCDTVNCALCGREWSNRQPLIWPSVPTTDPFPQRPSFPRPQRTRVGIQDNMGALQ